MVGLSSYHSLSAGPVIADEGIIITHSIALVRTRRGAAADGYDVVPVPSVTNTTDCLLPTVLRVAEVVPIDFLCSFHDDSLC